MSLKVQSLMQIIETFAPKKLAEDWDNVGLLLGDPNKKVNRILVALDIDQNTVEEAIALNCDVIVAHHPLIFKPLKAIREDLPLGKIISNLIRNNIAVYCAHTNLDISNGGINDVLASLLELKEVQPLSQDKQEQLYKVVVYVPETHLDNIKQAMAAAGAGHIGNYSHCFFATAGEGSFKPLEGTSPYIGTPGQIETVKELRLETVVPDNILRKVISAMLKAHPYEEVAYDVYALENEGIKAGLGRIGLLKEPISLEAFVTMVKARLGLKNVKVVGDLQTKVAKVALVGGAGASYISTAAFRGADCLLTGDIKYHEAQDAMQKKLSLIDAGHFETEIPVLAHLAASITSAMRTIDETVEVLVANSQKTPFTFM